MLVKGIIKTIDYQGNTCTVRIPVLESAGNNTEVCLPATFAITPGIYNGYKVDDVVFVGFEDNMLSSPVVFGKLFLGADQENKDPRGAINTESFKAKEPISIPLDTKLVLDNNPKKLNAVRVKNGLSDYKTIADIIKGLQHQNKEIGSLDAKLIDDGEKLGAEISKKVPANSGDTQRGLSWYLTTDKWEIDANDTTELGLQKLPLVTIDRKKMTIYSDDLKIVGYSLGEELKYAKSQDPNHAPTGPDVQWQDGTAGLWQEGWYIWKRTRIIKWHYNETADRWEHEYDNPSYECITGATGSTGISINAFNYWYLAYPKNSTPVLDEPFTEPPTSNSGTKIWQNTPPSSTADTDDLWVVVESIFEDDTPETRHFTYNTPVLDTTYALAQGKSTNYYSDTDPSLTHLVKDGDCWFDTNIELGKLHNIENYINTYVLMPVEQNGETVEQAVKITAENITDPDIYNFLNNWAPQTVVQVKYVLDELTGERIEPAEFHPEDYFVKLDYKFIDLVSTAIMYKEDIQAYGRSSIDSEDRFVYIGRESDPDYGIVNKWRKQNTDNNEFVDTEFIVYTNDIARKYSPSDPRIIFTVTQEQLDDDIRVNVIAYSENPLDPAKANYLKQWVGAPSGTPGGNGHWEDVGGEIVANKVTAAYINALGITAKRIHVLDADNNTLFLADADHPDDTQLGGLKVEENKLAFKEQDEQNSFKLETGNSGYVCYRSTNHHIAEHTSTSLIWIKVLEPIDSLTIYIRSTGNPDYDYCMATDTNTYYSNLPTQADDQHVVAHTKGNPQAGTTLASYTPVTYTNLAASSRFFVLYQKNSTSSTYDDYGYVLFNAADLQKLELFLENDRVADYIVPFERYDTTDIDYKKTELLIGKKFKVDGAGNLSTANTTVNGRIDTQVLALNGLRLDTSTGTTQLNIEYYKLAYEINSDGSHYYFDYTVTCVDYNNIIRPITETKTLRLSYILCYRGSWGGYNFTTNAAELTFMKDTFIIQGSIDIGTTRPESDRSTATISPESNKTQVNFRNSIGSFADSKNCVFKDYELFPSDETTAARFFSRLDIDGAGHTRILELDLSEFLAEEGWKKIYWVHCEVVNRADGLYITLDKIKSKYTYYTTYLLASNSYMADPVLWTGIICPQYGTTFSWLIGQDLRTDSISGDYGLEVEYNWQNPSYDPNKATIAYIKVMVYGER